MSSMTSIDLERAEYKKKYYKVSPVATKGHDIYTKTKNIWWKVTASLDLVVNYTLCAKIQFKRSKIVISRFLTTLFYLRWCNQYNQAFSRSLAVSIAFSIVYYNLLGYTNSNCRGSIIEYYYLHSCYKIL